MKFSVGEVAVYVGPEVSSNGMPGWPHGTLVRIDEVFPFGEPVIRGRYRGMEWIQWYGIDGRVCPERYLEKRRPKDQHTPAEQSFPELIEYLNRVTANQEESR